MSEQAADEREPALQAAEDQAIAAARHVAECAVKFWNVCTEGGIPDKLAGKILEDWFCFFVNDDGAEDD